MIKDLNQSILPFDKLSDRVFEEIVYQILSIENKSPNIDVKLMPQGKDGGKDIFITQNSKLKKIIQCKKYKENLSKSFLLEEIGKFALNHYQILTDKISYEIWIANDFKKEVYDLNANGNNLTDEDYCKIITRLHTNYSELKKHYTQAQGVQIIKDFFTNKLKVIKLVTGLDITIKIKKHDEIYKNYFEHKRVVSYEDLEKYMENYNSNPIYYCFKDWITDKIKDYLEFLLQLVDQDNFLSLSKSQFQKLNEFYENLRKKIIDPNWGRLKDVFISFRSVFGDFLKLYSEWNSVKTVDTFYFNFFNGKSTLL